MKIPDPPQFMPTKTSPFLIKDHIKECHPKKHDKENKNRLLKCNDPIELSHSQQLQASSRILSNSIRIEDTSYMVEEVEQKENKQNNMNINGQSLLGLDDNYDHQQKQKTRLLVDCSNTEEQQQSISSQSCISLLSGNFNVPISLLSGKMKDISEEDDSKKEEEEEEEENQNENTHSPLLEYNSDEDGSSICRQLSNWEEKMMERLHKRKSAWMSWVHSLQHLDPRYQILSYFDEVAREGGPLKNPLAPPPSTCDPMRAFMKASAFTVWRPTSLEAIAKMMKGEVTGKGLEIKGKSAQRGKLSSLVPFVQIYHNHQKKLLIYPPKWSRIRVYYKTDESRSFAENILQETMEEMAQAYDIHSKMPQMYKNEVNDPQIYRLNESGIGLDIPERVFFKTYITRQNLERTSEFMTGRASIPEFQDMNGYTIRKYEGSGPRAVVLQTCTDPLSEGLCPQGLVVSYEDEGTVTPVASDFDCFTVGTRGVSYDKPMPEEQVDLMKWQIQKTEKILSSSPRRNETWTSQWLKVLKQSSSDGFNPTVPKYGFGDPKSYEIMEGAANRFRHCLKNGAVRHGAECFNFHTPQELDETFLVISDTLPGNIPWVYVGVDELKDMLSEKIDEDFCFPINPKWILADIGWKKLWDKMLASTCTNTIESMETWYPKDSGIREMIEAVHKKFPRGYAASKYDKTSLYLISGSTKMVLAQERLRRHLILRRVKLKLKAVMIIGKLGGYDAFKDKKNHEMKNAKLLKLQKKDWNTEVLENLNAIIHPHEPTVYLLIWLLFIIYNLDN